MVRATRLALRLQTAARAAQRLELATARAAANGSLLQRAYTSQALRNAKPTIAVRTMTTTATQLGGDQSQQKKQDPFSSPETQILEHALNHVAEFGWSVDALAAGAKDIGYPSVAHGMLPRGAIELVDFFMDRSFEQTRATLVTHTAQLQAMSVADRLKFGVRTRLELLAPVVHTWPQAMALGALPQNAPSTMRKLAQLADEIWYFAGDKSTDASWYTKRALLTGIYASTELFLLSDASPNFEETWKFLDRRIEETITLGDLPRNLEDVAGMVNIGVQSFLSAAVSLAGPLGSQIVKSSPLGNVPNPISAIGNVVVPPSVAAGLASAGFPPNPLSGGATPSPFPTSGNDFEPTDLREIDQELEKLGGSDARRN